MARVLMLFLDGVGLGADDPKRNPFAVARMPALIGLMEGRRLLAGSAPFVGERASLLAVDACMGVAGLPQSATGQASLLTGRNVSAEIGMHYGPKPNPAIRDILTEDNLFALVRRKGEPGVDQRRSAWLFRSHKFRPPPVFRDSVRRHCGRLRTDDRRGYAPGTGDVRRFHRRRLGRTARFPYGARLYAR
ncbi:MAG: hypothetical protein P8Z41_00970 [Anaerolineales bacterium]